MEITTATVDTRLGWLFSRRYGTGRQVVLCIHGYCQSSAYWVPTLARIRSTGASAIAVDLPGFGDSAHAPGPYTMEGYADDLAGFLDATEIDRVVLVGGSMGGVVAQHFALRHPERLHRLVLVATGARTPDPDGALAKADSLATHAWTDADIAGMVAGFFARLPPETERQRYEAVVRAASPAAAVEAARSNARSNTLDQLGLITVPTLIVQGRHDRGRTAEHGALMRERLADARLVVMENSGHTPQLEEPDAFHQAILPFIREAAG